VEHGQNRSKSAIYTDSGSVYRDQTAFEGRREGLPPLLQPGIIQSRGFSMSETITIPSDLEEELSRRAAASGKDVKEYALEVLRRDAELPDLRELFADVREQIRASGVSDDELDVQIEEAVKEVRMRRRG
jgi:hypothetical protein